MTGDWLARLRAAKKFSEPPMCRNAEIAETPLAACIREYSATDGILSRAVGAAPRADRPVSGPAGTNSVGAPACHAGCGATRQGNFCNKCGLQKLPGKASGNLNRWPEPPAETGGNPAESGRAAAFAPPDGNFCNFCISALEAAEQFFEARPGGVVNCPITRARTAVVREIAAAEADRLAAAIRAARKSPPQPAEPDVLATRERNADTPPPDLRRHACAVPDPVAAARTASVSEITEQEADALAVAIRAARERVPPGALW